MSSEIYGSHEGQRSLGGTDEASSLHLEVPIEGLVVYEEEEQELSVVVVVADGTALLAFDSEGAYSPMICGLLVSLWPLFMIMSGDRVDAMDSDSSRD